jgi:nucleotide-binding universal stress UspA family protein
LLVDVPDGKTWRQIMAFRTVLVHAQDNEVGHELLEQAAALAQAQNGHLVALVVGVQPTAPYATMVDVPLEGYVEDIQRARDATRQEAEKLTGHLDRLGGSYEVRAVAVPPGMVGTEFARHARYADIALFPKPDDSGVWHQTVDTTLFESGKPVMICPRGARLDPIGKRVALAWNAGREAARSINDSLPLITGADDVRIVMVDPHVGPWEHGEEPGADMATMLARHGLPVQVDALPRADRSFADSFLAHARDMAADLLVCGAYGHSRFSEMLLGGATRDLMDETDRPVLMSH